METVKPGSTIQSLQVGMKIIDLIVATGTPLRFSDIQESTKITKSNLYKYLNTLTLLEILYRDKTTGMYHLGSKLIQYGMAAIGQEDIITRVTPYLQEITQHSNCSVIFAVWTYDGPVIAKIWNSNQSLNIGAQTGSLLPPSSSSGKIFSVFHDSFATSKWLSKEHAGSEYLNMSEQELQSIKKNKISFAKEPLAPSVSSTSIPILNYSAELLGAVTVVGFEGFVPTKPLEELSRYLINKSLEISRNFGYNPK
ncbi:IclR family transcriptional regulator [Salipaludibacillus sp. CF4.18]|uniref:IclR family transcriptional regulator n=1 Tax=Salipaludibacillus sp. CF4.18 TaxID=3373081 RepID=UPI003EE678C0